MITPNILSPANLPILHFEDGFGNPLVDGLLFTFKAGTNTPVETYADENGQSINTNPIVLDSRGECRLWLIDGKRYKFVLKHSNGADIWTQDNITNVSFFADIESSDETIDVEKKIEGKSYLFNIKASSALMQRIREIEEKVKPKTLYNGAVFDPADENAEGREGLVDSDGAIIGFFDF